MRYPVQSVFIWNRHSANLCGKNIYDDFLKSTIFHFHSLVPRHSGPHFFCDPLPSPMNAGTPLDGPPSVLYIYNEIQIHISRTVSTPRVTVWILLTLISWIMLIFTLSAHRQQTPHDMVVVTAVSACCRVSACVWCWGWGGWLVCAAACVCVLEGLPCCQTDLHEKGRSNYITYANKECTHAHTYIHTTDGLLLRSKRQCERSF